MGQFQDDLDWESPDRKGERKLFEGFDPHTAAKLVELGIEAWFDTGKLVFEEHDTSSQFYLITQGSVALEQPAPGRPVRIQTLHEGDFLGWSALLGSGTRRFQARALSRVAVLAFDGAALRRYCDKDAQFGYRLMHRLLLLATERLDALREQLIRRERA